MNSFIPQQNFVPFPAPNTPGSTYLQPVAQSNSMPTYYVQSGSSHHHSRPRSYSTSHHGHGGYAYAQPVAYSGSHHSDGSRHSHSHSHNHGGRSHSHSRHHSTSGYRDSGRRHRSSSHNGRGHYPSTPAYTYGNYPASGGQAYYPTTGGQAQTYYTSGQRYQTGPQVARVDSRYQHNVLATPHRSHHSRRYSEPSLGDRIRNFFHLNSPHSHSHHRTGNYIDARTGRKVDHRGREVYRV